MAIFRRVAQTVVLVAVTATPLGAEVVRIDVQSRADLLGGQTFGSAGPYEKLSGTIHFSVDPALPANRSVKDLEKATRNDKGRVEFSADFYLIKPKNIERGNRAVLFEVSNRGGKGMLGFFNRAAGSLDPVSAAQIGDGFLMKQGFTLLWVGWQFDVPHRSGLMRLSAPPAMENGRPIRGLVRSEIIVTERETDHSLADRDHVPYAVADPDSPDNVVTVRDTADGPRRVVPRSAWQFVPDGGAAGAAHLHMSAGFEPQKIYEVVFVAQDSPVAGLGAAAVRDVVSMLKYGSAETWSVPRASIDRALAFGVSQSGRFLRTYLYDGFNRDEKDRKVFDGVIAHVAGGGRGSFNHRFAQPSRDGHPYLNLFYPTDIFPFTDLPQTDPETGVTDGLLTHAGQRELLPKVFYTNSEYEYWGRAASLIHTTVDGSADAPLMDNVRIYLLTAGQHGPGAFPPVQTLGQQKSNPLDYRWTMRALLLAMDRWAATGAVPPPSRYPRVADGTLVPPDRLRFPKVPGVTTSTAVKGAYRVDYGSGFAKDGVITQEPPRVGAAFPILVPQVDADGNGLAGVRMPELAVPLATYTGWNLFNPRSGPRDALAAMQGSYVPFPRTSAERKQANDPRLSVQERYRDKDQYLALVKAAAQRLVGEGFLLGEDVSGISQAAGRHWDYVWSPVTSTTGGR
ncbi:MAG: hypothetical protein DMF90_00920 [Acidobacteria bacterium]|nr:MAG: hypothetical protein DMF90_00920 [Acidobacteriota bacterium]